MKKILIGASLITLSIIINSLIASTKNEIALQTAFPFIYLFFALNFTGFILILRGIMDKVAWPIWLKWVLALIFSLVILLGLYVWIFSQM